MSTVLELLSQLRVQGVNISLDGDALKINAPKGIITPEYRQLLSARKPEIIAFLRTSLDAARAGGLAIAPIPRTTTMPLSFAQQRLWFLHQLDGGGPAYNIPAGLRMQGSLDIPILERALAGIIARHEGLRTRFINKDGTPYSVIDAVTTWHLERIDLQGLPPNERNAAGNKQAIEFSQRPFDLAQGSLTRSALIILDHDTHLLIVTMHHIISDGWSMGVLVRELTDSYSALKRGAAPEIAPLAIQYVDFAQWQREWLESGELDRQLPYWQKQLAGAPPMVVFPTDFQRPQSETFRGSRSRIVISRSLVTALEQLSRAQNVTLFMLLLTAFKTLLHRYTGLEDVVVGTPSANRNRSELHPLIGFFVNNLVLRTAFSGNPTFLDVLIQVREVTLRAYDQQDVPFDRLVQALHTERSTDHSPLFQTMFSFQNFPLDDLQLPDLVITPLELDAKTARFDLTVEIYPHHGELRTYFEYKTDLYHSETIAALQNHFLALLESIVANPSQLVSSISFLSEEERRDLIDTRNQTAAFCPADICVHQRFEQLAIKHPERIAVASAIGQLSYGQLNMRANRIAHRLIDAGVVPGNLVGIYIDRGTDLVAGLLSILKVGAAYVPLDPIYPAKRIAGILEDAQPTVLLTTEFLRESLPEFSSTLICIDALPHTDADEDSNPDVALNQNDLAYVIFTSGSTGKPKGVQISHGALINFLESMSRSPGLTADDVLLAVTTISFDIAGLELYLPLYVGASVYISARPNDAAVLLEELVTVCPTTMQATPATWQMLISSGWEGDSQLKVLCGGEALEPALARSLIARSSSVWNMYGPTETTIWSAVLRVECPDGGSIPIGLPISNTTFYTLDAKQELVPIGVAGELYIGGSGLARGYLNRPDLTEERFISDPFHPTEPGARLYRTGDLVRYRRTGELEFLGRIDHQVKLRGFRIELGEIEHGLRGLSGVQDAVVVLRDDIGEKSLVAYLVTNQVDGRSGTSLRDDLRQSLPDYMIPRFFVYLDEFPRTPNGKLDRSALPAPERTASKTIYVAPSTDAERSVAEVFKKLLHLERLSIKDNFFELGAHSLLIAKAHDMLKRAVDPDLQLIDFFQYPTIEALANVLDKRGLPPGSSQRSM